MFSKSMLQGLNHIPGEGSAMPTIIMNAAKSLNVDQQADWLFIRQKPTSYAL